SNHQGLCTNGAPSYVTECLISEGLLFLFLAPTGGLHHLSQWPSSSSSSLHHLPAHLLTASLTGSQVAVVSDHFYASWITLDCPLWACSEFCFTWTVWQFISISFAAILRDYPPL